MENFSYVYIIHFGTTDIFLEHFFHIFILGGFFIEPGFWLAEETHRGKEERIHRAGYQWELEFRTFLHGGKRARLCGIVGGFLLHMNDDFYVYNDSPMIFTIYDWGGTKLILQFNPIHYKE